MPRLLTGLHDTDFKQKKKLEYSRCGKVEDSGNERTPADNNSTATLGNRKLLVISSKIRKKASKKPNRTD